MMTAYMDGNDYFYRINDDTNITTPRWTERLIEELAKYDPPNVGVVGPNDHGGCIHDILCYEFVHRTHVDIFGFHYPRFYTTWAADRWIEDVYKPKRSGKILDVKVTHTRSEGTRYNGSLPGTIKELRKTIVKSEQKRLTRLVV